MAGDKYKVKITNVGVGDPFILFKVQFQDGGTPPDGGTWTLPSNVPLSNLAMNVSLCNGAAGTNPDEYQLVGNVSVVSIATENVYLFGLPFDQGNFPLGDQLSVYVTFYDADGNDIYIYGDNPDESHLAWYQTLNFYDAPKNFNSLMVYYNWEDS